MAEIPSPPSRPGRCGHLARRGVRRAAAGLIFVVLLAGGCSRAFYRVQADREVYCLENQASEAVSSPNGPLSIQPSPVSRMYDPNSPDCPPMPPDDPVSHRLMRCVDGKRGWRGWACYGHTPFVENPNWAAYLPRDEQGGVVLDRQAAMQLALCNSRDYQTQLENLYLSALEVTFQRFRFDAQFFAGNDTSFEALGRELGGGRSQSLLETDTDVVMNKLFAGGGELVVGAANSLVWQFAGPDEYRGMTLLDFSFIQPLLRAGGRAVVLEALTDSERALVANIRQMERFQQGFYAMVVAGRTPGSGPSAGGITLGSLNPGGGGGVGGFLALLQQQVLIRNRRANAVALRDSLAQLKEFFKGGEVDYFQVEQTRLQLYNAEVDLLDLQNQYQNTLDSYKMVLGLPPDLELEIRDPLLGQFQLISADLTEAQDRVTSVLADLRDPKADSVLSEDVKQLDPIVAECRIQLRAVVEDVRRLDEVLPTRREHLRQLATRPEFQRGDVDPSIVDTAQLDERIADLKSQFAELRVNLGRTLADVASLRKKAGDSIPPSGAEKEAMREQFRDVVEVLSGQMIELSLYQAKSRLEAIALKPLELDPQRALEIARTHRVDWMNARAALVDVWRQVEVVANELESDLDVTFSGDLSTINDNPIRFRGTAGRLRVGLEFDAPLTRLVERNAYRRALINYQQARRQYYAYEDGVNQALRRTLRAIRLAQINFEQRRAAVYVAATKVDLKQYDLLHKPVPLTGGGLGEVAARDVIDALNDLLNEQNNLLRVWVDYEVERLNLAFDLGTMKLDERGMWIDEGSFEADLSAPETDGPEIIAPGAVGPEGVAASPDGEETSRKAASRRTPTQAAMTRPVHLKVVTADDRSLGAVESVAGPTVTDMVVGVERVPPGDLRRP